MMRKFFVMAVLLTGPVFSPAFADFIEIKDRGILDGKVVSSDADSITFKSHEGQTERFSRKEVLYVDDTPERLRAVEFKGTLKEKMEHVVDMAQELWEKLTHWVSKKTTLPDRPTRNYD